MKRRVFVAINLPEKVKKGLASYQDKWPELPVRWTKKDNLHITLEFFGCLAEGELLNALKDTEELASRHKPFSVTLNKTCYGPPGKPARMVWAIGDRVKELDLLPHITLGRINVWEFRKIEPEERPVLDEDININFKVSSIEIMESVLKRGGPEYTILKSYNLF